MADHPFKAALIVSGVADDISQAVETYVPYAVTSIAEITAQDLSRVKVVILATGGQYAVYLQDPSNTDPEDGVNVIFDENDTPFVKVAAAGAAGAVQLSEITGAGDITISATSRGARINRTLPEAADIYFPESSARNGLPITIADAAGNFEAYPQTIYFGGTDTARGASTFICDSNWAVYTFYPQTDGTWILG